MVMITAVILAVFLALGIMFSLGKGSGIISAFSGKREETEDGADGNKQTKTMGALMLSCAGCMLLALIGSVTETAWLTGAGYGLLAVCAAVFGIIDYTRTKK